jgi:hypothetical protein
LCCVGLMQLDAQPHRCLGRSCLSACLPTCLPATNFPSAVSRCSHLTSTRLEPTQQRITRPDGWKPALSSSSLKAKNVEGRPPHGDRSPVFISGIHVARCLNTALIYRQTAHRFLLFWYNSPQCNFTPTCTTNKSLQLPDQIKPTMATSQPIVAKSTNDKTSTPRTLPGMSPPPRSRTVRTDSVTGLTMKSLKTCGSCAGKGSTG